MFVFYIKYRNILVAQKDIYDRLMVAWRALHPEEAIKTPKKSKGTKRKAGRSLPNPGLMISCVF